MRSTEEEEAKESVDRSWILRRARLGACHALLQEVRIEEPRAFRSVVRMDEQTFDHLLQLVRPSIQKTTTNVRVPIPAGERLALCLRILASGKPIIYNER